MAFLASVERNNSGHDLGKRYDGIPILKAKIQLNNDGDFCDYLFNLSCSTESFIKGQYLSIQ